MRLNADTTLASDQPGPASTSSSPPPIRLVPYLPAHVPAYHAWMEDEVLRSATGSERLSLAEEHDMQAAWADDPDKLTFIILDGAALAAAEAGGATREDAALQAMIGDVNLFFTEEGEDEEAGGGGDDYGGPFSAATAAAEVEIMIASPAARGKGFGAAAVRLMLAYARTKLGTRRVTAKVGRGNEASLRLFEGRLGFSFVKEVPVFDERHLRVVLPATGPHAAVAEAWVEEGHGAWVRGERRGTC